MATTDTAMAIIRRFQTDAVWQGRLRSLGAINDIEQLAVLAAELGCPVSGVELAEAFAVDRKLRAALLVR